MFVDPLAEQTMTPYQYVTNNPIMFTDPTGMVQEGAGDGNKERSSWVSRAWSTVKSWFGWKNSSVIVEEPIFEGYAEPLYEEKSNVNYRLHGYKISGDIKSNLNKTNIDISGFSYGYNSESNENEISGGASIYALSASAETRLGTNSYNMTEKVEGSIFKAELKGTLGGYSGDKGKYGFKINAEANAIALDASYTRSFTIAGVRIGYTSGSSIGSAHIGGSFSAFYDKKTREGEISLMGQYGLGLPGFKYGLFISNTRREFNFNKKSK